MAEVDSVVDWEKKYEYTDGVCPLKHMSRFAPLEVLSLSLNIVTLVIVKTKPIKVNILLHMRLAHGGSRWRLNDSDDESLFTPMSDGAAEIFLSVTE